MIAEGEFCGKKDAAGYQPGVTYKFKVYKHNVIKRLDGTGRIHYNSLSEFLKDWFNVRYTGI